MKLLETLNMLPSTVSPDEAANKLLCRSGWLNLMEMTEHDFERFDNRIVVIGADRGPNVRNYPRFWIVVGRVIFIGYKWARHSDQKSLSHAKFWFILRDEYTGEFPV